MYFNAIRENKILAKISEFTVYSNSSKIHVDFLSLIQNEFEVRWNKK